MSSEYETVRLEDESAQESAASPWDGGAVPLRRASKPDAEQARRLEVVARGARRRRVARRTLGSVPLIALALIAAWLLASSSKEAKEPGSLRALAQAPAARSPSRVTLDAKRQRSGHNRREREARERRAPRKRPAPAAAKAPSQSVVEGPTPPAPEVPAPEPAPLAPPPEPSGGEAAAAEFGFEN